MSIYAGQSPSQLYRTFFRHLRHLPDPHVWSILQPRVRHLLERSRNNGSDHAESSAQAALRAKRARRRAEDEIRKLHMAVGCYTHALRRLIGDCYGRTGSVRWELINNLAATSAPPIRLNGRPALPPVLKPLAPRPVQPPPMTARARTTLPETAIRKREARTWTKHWRGVSAPLAILGVDGPGPKTGWEDRGVVESLRALARMDPTSETAPPSSLPTWHNLSPKMQRIFPAKLRPSPPPQYDPPPPRATRQNPGTWSGPHQLTNRALRRTYERLWDSLPWVTLVDKERDEWKRIPYEELVTPGPTDEATKGKKARKIMTKLAARSTTSKMQEGSADDVRWL